MPARISGSINLVQSMFPRTAAGECFGEGYCRLSDRTATRDFFYMQDQITPETATRLPDGVGEVIQVEILCLAFEAVQIENDALLFPALHGLHPFGRALLNERGEQFSAWMGHPC
jgi:hypothetical protein